MSRISPARRAAFDLLLELEQNPQAHSDDLLGSERVDALSPADRNLATTLVMGVLRWKAALDDRIVAALTKAKSQLAAPVELALELGALQLLLLDRIPAHAAIFESVELAKASGNAHAAGLVNAILRKLAGSPKLGTASGPPLSAGEIARAWAHPPWLVARWVQRYGAANAAAICRFDQYPPPAVIRLQTPEAEDALLEEGVQLEAGAFVERARRVARGDVTRTRAFAQGLVRIQDEGSQLIAELAGRGSAIRGSTILDCCAAPGGKTAILAERNPEASILACDIHAGRLERMRGFLSRHKGTDRISYRVLDAREMEFNRQFDLVLCDVPCSGTGTLARNPEIRRRITLDLLRRQQERQVRILSAAMRSLVPGGRLVYSTCSLEEEENEAVVDQLLQGQKEFQLLSWAERMRVLEGQGIFHVGSADALLGSSARFLRTLPGIHPCDGFFGALLTRV